MGRAHGVVVDLRVRQSRDMAWNGGQALSALWEWSILLSSVHKVGKLVRRRTLWPKKARLMKDMECNHP